MLHDGQQLLAGYVLDNLQPEEAAQLAALLAENPELMTEIQQLQTALALLALTSPPAQPAPAVKAQIINAVQAKTAQIKPQRLTRPLRLRWLVVGSAAATFVGICFQAVHLQRQLVLAQTQVTELREQLTQAQATLANIRQNELPQTQQQLSRYEAAVSVLRQPDHRYLAMSGMAPDIPSSGSLIIAPEAESAVLVMRDVATPAQGKTYRMWARVNGVKVACGDFLPNEDGNVFTLLPVNQWGNTPEVVITIEPIEAKEPVGEMVIVGS